MDPKLLLAWAKDLKKAREMRGLAIKVAAKEHGVSQGTWWNWESGVSFPQGRHLEPLLVKWPEIRMPGDNRRSLSSLV